MMLNILVVAHSTAVGGAESALKNLITLLSKLGHRVIVLVPDNKGEFVAWCATNNLVCVSLPMQSACPNTTWKSFYQVSQLDFKHLAAQLQVHNLDMVVTNTLVILHGSVLAAELKIPHVMVVHEVLIDSSEMQTSGFLSNSYLRLIARSSDYLLCCSEAVQAQFNQPDMDVKTGVLYPFLSAGWDANAVTVNARKFDAEPFHLLFVGVQSNRKNPMFALAVLQALRLRGHNVLLHCIGSLGPQSPRLQSAIQYRGLGQFVRMHEHTPLPFNVVQGKKINLVCATSEPFGLTMTEALALGIPVVASRSGGPACVLPDEDLFDVGDIDRCVRIIERMMSDYQSAHDVALQHYATILPRLSIEHQSQVVADALATAQAEYRDKPEEFFHGRRFYNAINLQALSIHNIAENIASVAERSLDEINSLIAAERVSMGAAVLADCRKYDVVPFSPSAKMDDLYREGIGFAIELAATYGDSGRLLMAAFILSKMMDESANRPLKVLAFGDGIGTDTLRLAAMGFDVDYMDFDASITAAVARKNFESYARNVEQGMGRVTVINKVAAGQSYDAIVCLEVIEHVSDPKGFLRYLSELLADNGLLFISECFDGVQNFWPTHLASNEDLGGLLPIMGLEEGLQLEDCNTDPNGKPYVFRKVATAAALVDVLRRDKNLFRALIRSQIKIGL